ncbi:MAG: conjugal transfer protein TraE [Phocaeicola vulgatus]|uniref:Conjugal transfer protein TraE n=1 Tax=Phocaeicola vulgatus TaxID=821 RepID=A0A1Q6JKF4_PHOVU|nr:MAG: conjugal transfer protein TraE [Phocaeicola vulgatus]
METCKYGLGASTRKPPTARWVWRWDNEEQDVKKKIMMVVGACIFLIAAAQALPMFFGIGA